jgi:hypothetical protein
VTDALLLESDVRRIWAALRFVDAPSGRAVDGRLAVQVPGARLQRNVSGLWVLTTVDAPAERRAEFQAYEEAFDPVPEPAALALAGTVADPLGRYLPRAFALALPRAVLPPGLQAPRFQPQDVVLDFSPAAPLLPTWAVLRVAVRHQGRPAAQAALRLQRPGGGALLGRGCSDARGEALVVAAGVPQLSAGAGAVVVQRELDAELVLSFDPAADAALPQDPDALALRAGVVRRSLALRIASGRVQTLAVDLP